MIVVACRCGRRLQARDEHAGMQASCPGCGAVLDVPTAPAIPVLDMLDDQQPPSPVPEARSVFDAAKAAVFGILIENGQGSGFHAGFPGVVVTNAHVVGHATRVAVGLLDGSRVEAEVVQSLPMLDLAFIRLDASALKGAPLLALTRPDDVTPGEPVYAIGNPLGLEHSITQGIVSAPRRRWEGRDFVQTDTPINPGNSGGPLLDGAARVVGVISWGIRGADGLSFAIPADVVEGQLQDLLTRLGAGGGCYCVVCGGLSRDSRYCDTCGSEFGETSATEATPPAVPTATSYGTAGDGAGLPWSCSCGTYVVAGDVYCPVCGASR